MDDSPVDFSDEKKERSEDTERRYLALASPSSTVASTSTPIFSHATATSSAFDLHSIEEKKEEEPHSTKVDPSASASPPLPVHHISVASKQKSSTIDAAALPAAPCPGQQYEWTWRGLSLLYYGR